MAPTLLCRTPTTNRELRRKRGQRRPVMTTTNMDKILLVSGTRPEIIKLAPVYHALRNAPWADARWLHTGQHAEMAQQILSCFDIVPDFSLPRSGTTLSEFSAAARR